MVAPTVDVGTLRKTPLYDEHVALGARVVPFAGYAMPVQYEGVVAEHRAVRTAAGLFDVSHMGELHLDGEDALPLVDGLVTNAAHKLPVGKAVYTVACREDGGILDDLIVYRTGEASVLVVCNASNVDKIAGHFGAAAERAAADGKDVRFRNASDDTALVALQGPRAFDVLAAAGATGDPAPADLKRFRLGPATVAGVECLAARTGYTGEDGVELFCANADAPKLWRGLLEAGGPHGLAPAGLGARDTLRLEASLCLYGQDIDETTNPLEAGLGWVVKPKNRSFVGKDALARVAEEGPARRLVGFEMTGRGIARHGYPIVKAGAGADATPIGQVTSGSPAPTLGKNVGMGYVPADVAAPGTEIGVVIRGKVAAAQVVEMPFYRRG